MGDSGGCIFQNSPDGFTVCELIPLLPIKKRTVNKCGSLVSGMHAKCLGVKSTDIFHLLPYALKVRHIEDGWKDGCLYNKANLAKCSL